jgi:hypothetical protein
MPEPAKTRAAELADGADRAGFTLVAPSDLWMLLDRPDGVGIHAVCDGLDEVEEAIAENEEEEDDEEEQLVTRYTSGPW